MNLKKRLDVFHTTNTIYLDSKILDDHTDYVCSLLSVPSCFVLLRYICPAPVLRGVKNVNTVRMFSLWNLVTHMGVFPVVDDLLHVVKRVEQEVITPFNPVNGHSAILVHTDRDRPTRKLEHILYRLWHLLTVL